MRAKPTMQEVDDCWTSLFTNIPGAGNIIKTIDLLAQSRYFAKELVRSPCTFTRRGLNLKQRLLGSSGARVSEIGLGCNGIGSRIDREASRSVVYQALDLGVTFFDTSDVYGQVYEMPYASELCLGEVLGDRRKEVFLATKFGNERTQYDAFTKGGASRRIVMIAVEASLKRLRTDWIDLYQIHKPDRLTPIEETLRALDDLVTQGKVRYIGCSNLAAWQVVDAHWTAKHLRLNGFVTCQSEYSLLVRDIESELIPAMRAHGIGLLPYFPLACGLLSGKYKRGTSVSSEFYLGRNKRWGARFLNDQNWGRVEPLERFCAERGRTLLQLAFGWLLAQPVISTVIAGATSPEQVAMNAAAGAWVPTAEELAEIDRLSRAV